MSNYKHPSECETVESKLQDLKTRKRKKMVKILGVVIILCKIIQQILTFI